MLILCYLTHTGLLMLDTYRILACSAPIATLTCSTSIHYSTPIVTWHIWFTRNLKSLNTCIMLNTQSLLSTYWNFGSAHTVPWHIQCTWLQHENWLSVLTLNCQNQSETNSPKEIMQKFFYNSFKNFLTRKMGHNLAQVGEF